MIQTGDWVLFEARFPTNTMGLVIGDRLIPTIMFGQLQRRVNNIPAKIWVDDLRVQPADAQMTTYVYDPVSLRLVASFDDQHFALRYQYNAEGKLIRKQADTERGLKTLQETHYHTPASTQVDE
jgi:YD repeat-containing protein